MGKGLVGAMVCSYFGFGDPSSCISVSVVLGSQASVPFCSVHCFAFVSGYCLSAIMKGEYPERVGQLEHQIAFTHKESHCVTDEKQWKAMPLQFMRSGFSA